MNDLYHRFPRSLREANWMRHNAGLEVFTEDRSERGYGGLLILLVFAAISLISFWGMKT